MVMNFGVSRGSLSLLLLLLFWTTAVVAEEGRRMLRMPSARSSVTAAFAMHPRLMSRQVAPFWPRSRSAPKDSRDMCQRWGRRISHLSSDASESGGGEGLFWTTDRVRSTFVEYFSERHQHTFQPSSSCVPLQDPTLLFTNAGMNQFKPIFLGQVDPSSPLAKLRRAVNSQKCIRAGGKHNDLDDVGLDTYHHTYFEMLGSWSFGDYFKPDAVRFAWELLTQVYHLDPSRLYATYFEGDASLGLEEDIESRDLWLQYLPPERVIKCNAKDNFWEMGETGPCGPCTEIHYDRIGDRDASALVNADDPNVIEIWNVVFIQYNRDVETGLSSLPQKHVDTGMGLERLVSVLQNKSSNYDIDTFARIFRAIEPFSKVGPYEGRVGPENDTDLKDTAYRAVADHARALTFAIADGAVPNNEGRGYVLRRILRRATRYGQQILQAEPGFFSQLIPVVVDIYGETYPEIVKAKDTIVEIVREEENAFSAMLDRGIKFFSELQSELQGSKKTQVSGDKAFFLYDTLGFPIDLTERMATEAGLSVDIAGFEQEMEEQKRRSREARKAGGSGGGVVLELIAEQTSFLADAGIATTDDSFKYEWDASTAATVQAIFTVDGFLSEGESASPGDQVGLILDKSSFYAEAGGQETDIGTITLEGGGLFTVRDVQTFGGYLLHTGVVEEGSFGAGSSVKCLVDYENRRNIAPNHSMTHVMHAALREVLGDGVEQRGSLVSGEKLRFDFSHKKAMTLDELRRTEAFVQKAIEEDLPVTATVMPLDEAKAIEGVRAVFGEVYPDPVRVVSVGSDTSIEFCGGTHISRTSEAQAFALVEETAVAKGIRRITAVTQGPALQAIDEGTNFEALVSTKEALPPDTPGLDKDVGAIRKELDSAYISAALKSELRGRIEGIQKAAVDAKKAAAAGRLDSCLGAVRDAAQGAVRDGKQVLVLNVDIAADSKSSQKVMNLVKEVAPSVAFMGISEEDPGSGGKAICFSVVPSSLVEVGLKADEWVRGALESVGGRGGGKPESAQGQAKECNDVSSILADSEAFADGKVGAFSS